MSREARKARGARKASEGEGGEEGERVRGARGAKGSRASRASSEGVGSVTCRLGGTNEWNVQAGWHGGVGSVVSAVVGAALCDRPQSRGSSVSGWGLVGKFPYSGRRSETTF